MLSDPRLTEEQRLLGESLDSYVRKREAARIAAGASFAIDSKGWRQLAADVGILGASFPHELGGLGGGAVENMVIQYVLGYHGLSTPYLDTIVFGGAVLRRVHPFIRNSLLPAVIDGEQLLGVGYPDYREGDAVGVAEPHAVQSENGTWLLDGEQTAVLDAEDCGWFIVSARVSPTTQEDRVGLGVFLIARECDGLSVEAYPRIDGGRAADLKLKGVRLSPEYLLGSIEDCENIIADALDEAVGAWCAESAGLLRGLLDRTIAYARERRQFGKALSQLQVIRHRIADMLIHTEHAASFAFEVAKALSRRSRSTRALVAAAKVYIGDALEAVARNAVQLHGAMGMMADGPVANHFRRATLLRTRFGSPYFHLRRLCEAGIDPFFDVDDSLKDAEFRLTVRTFIDGALTGEWRTLARLQTTAFAEPRLSEYWQRALAQRGWVAPTWPCEYGGPPWTFRERQIFVEECARAHAPRLPAMGLQMCGPVIMRFGSKAQKEFFLPRILSGEHYWCQGYSEPQAGSDLAALQLSAVRQADDYVLNGTKIWTTFAHNANWIFLLVRTANAGRPQAGITFLLCPLNLPGIEIRPLTSISGDHEVNQVFFTDVHVPVQNRIGEENAGWEVAKYLLQLERGAGPQVPTLLQQICELKEVAGTVRTARGTALWDESGLRTRLTRLEVDALALRCTEQRLWGDATVIQGLGDSTASLLKIGWSEVGQQVSDLSIQVLGLKGAALMKADVEPTPEHLLPAQIHLRTAMRQFMNDRVLTIAGGSSEILREILARKACGL